MPQQFEGLVCLLLDAARYCRTTSSWSMTAVVSLNDGITPFNPTLILLSSMSFAIIFMHVPDVYIINGARRWRYCLAINARNYPSPVVCRCRDMAEAANCNRDVLVELENSSVWRRFSSLGTEMIITKSGRYFNTHALLLS